MPHRVTEQKRADRNGDTFTPLVEGVRADVANNILDSLVSLVVTRQSNDNLQALQE